MASISFSTSHSLIVWLQPGILAGEGQRRASSSCTSSATPIQPWNAGCGHEEGSQNSPVWEDNASPLLCPSLQCPRVFPSWWWPCSPCKPCSGWQRRKGWRELSLLVGIPVVSSLLKLDYELSKCLIFPFTPALSFLVITPTVYWVPTTWKTLCREFSLSQPSQQFCQVSSICPFCRWETEGHGNEGIFSRWWQSMRCRGGILAYMTTQSILFLPP